MNEEEFNSNITAHAGDGMHRALDALSICDYFHKFVDYWNMVEQPLIFLKDAFKQPLSLYLSTLHKEAQGIGFAASLIYMAPMVLLFLYAEAYFIEGVQMSGIKG